MPAGSSSSSTDDKAQHNLHTWKALNSSSLEQKNGEKKERNWKRVLGREALVRLQQIQQVGRVLKVSAEDKNACANFPMKRD